MGLPNEPIKNLETLLNGIKVSSKLEYSYVDNENWAPDTEETGSLIAWYVIKMILPPGGKTTIERRYECANGDNQGGTTFEYIVHTGGGWYGKIGELRADLILGKDVVGTDYVFWPSKKEWQKTSGNSYRLIWKNFDPRQDEDKQDIRICD